MASEPNPRSEDPTTDELAGVYFYFEGNETVILPKADGKKPVETPPEWCNPTVEQLAGVNIYCEEGKVIYLNGDQQSPDQP